MAPSASPAVAAVPPVRRRFHFLLAALVGQLVVSPFLRGPTANILQDLIFLAILFAALKGVRQSRVFSLILVLTVLCGLALVAKYLAGWPGTGLASEVLGMAVILLTVVQVSKYLAAQRRVDLDTVLGGLCVYLFLGTLWYSLYGLVYSLVPDAFAFTLHGRDLAPRDINGLLFFSAT